MTGSAAAAMVYSSVSSCCPGWLGKAKTKKECAAGEVEKSADTVAVQTGQMKPSCD